MKHTFVIIAILLVVSCKSNMKQQEKSTQLKLAENIANFTSKMKAMDTVRITANLTMEHWVRLDELTLTKKNNELILQTTVKEDTSYMRKYMMQESTLSKLTLDNSENKFEHHFLSIFERTEMAEKEDWIYRIIHQCDTLKFYTSNLGDKGRCVREYYEFMTNYYPNEKEFKLIEVIED